MDVVTIKDLLIRTSSQHQELGRQFSALSRDVDEPHCEWLLGYLSRSERWTSRNIRSTCASLPKATQNIRLLKRPEWIAGELGFYVNIPDLSDQMMVVDTALHLSAQLTDGLRICRDQVGDRDTRHQLQILVNLDTDFQSHLARSLVQPLHLVQTNVPIPPSLV